MLLKIGLAWAMTLMGVTAQAEEVSFLFCEYESLGENSRWKNQSIPIYYESDQLVALGKRSHCIDEPQYRISETHASWRCITAVDANQTPIRSVYVEIHRYTGRYHRNDFDGKFDDLMIREIWHGVCTSHHEARF